MEEELVKKLKDIGLTDGESKVYLSLIGGKTTKSEIVRTSRVSPSIVYEILERLVQKGFVSYITVDGKKHFQANDPKIILDLLEKRKITAEDLVSILSKRRGGGILITQVYSGLDGLKSVLEDVEKEEFENGARKWLAMGVTAHKKEHFNSFWIRWHNQIRPKYKVEARFIFSEKNTEYYKELSKAPLSESKYLPFVNPSCITVVGKTVIIMKYSDPPSFIKIKNEDIANTFEGTFNTLWKNAE